VRNSARIWEDDTRVFGLAVPEFSAPVRPVIPDDCTTPYDYWTLFVTDDFVEELAKMSQAYAIKRDKPNPHKLTPNNLRLSMAIMYMTGYSTPSARHLYWENRKDTMNIAAKEAMGRNTFNEVIRGTYFTSKVPVLL